MKRWIRPQGIVVFLVLVVLIAGMAYVLSGTLVGRSIEKAGTAIVGARVDVGGARLSLSPLGLTLTDLQVTNPSRPMENTVQVGRIAFNMDPGALLRRKLLVEEMAAEGIAFNTPRKSSGAVQKRSGEAKEGSEGGGFKMPVLKIPPVSEILAQEDLMSARLSGELKEKAAAVDGNVRSTLSSLPDKAKAQDYRQRLEKLLAGDKISKARLDEAKGLQSEVRAQRDKVRAAQEQIASSLQSLRIQLKEAREAPGQDVTRLKNKYALTPEGLANVTRLLFGDKAGLWADRAVQALKLMSYLPSRPDQARVRPPRGRGVDVPLEDRIPLPDLWVKRAALSLKIPAGTLAGEARDLASDQALIGKVTTLKASGDNLPSGVSVKADGVLDHTNPSATRDEYRINYSGWKITDLALSESDSLPVTLRQGAGALAGSVVVKGEALKGTVRIDLTSVVMEAGGTGDSSLARAMRTALQGVRKFSLTADISGTMDDPGFRLSSDLDRILKDAVGQAAREEGARLEAGLRKAIEEKTGPALADAQRSLQSLESARAELEAVKAELEEALKVKAAVKLPF